MPDSLMPSYSLILPSRGSIARLTAMLESFQRDTAIPARCEIVARIDLDDPTREMRAAVLNGDELKMPVKVLMGNRGPIGAMQWECIQQARNEFCWLLNDDILSRTQDWDLMLDAVIGQQGRDWCYFPDDGIWGPKLGCFPMFPRADAERTKYFGCSAFERFSIDPVINQIYGTGLKRLGYVPSWKIQHCKGDVNEWDPRHSTSGVAQRDAARHADLVERGEIARMVALLGGSEVKFSAPRVMTNA
jgi:hypothetical protein